MEVKKIITQIESKKRMLILILCITLFTISNTSLVYSVNGDSLSENLPDTLSNETDKKLITRKNVDNLDSMKVLEIDRNKMKENNLSFVFFLSKSSKILTNYSNHYTIGEYICSWDIKDGKRKTIAYMGDDVWIFSMALSHDENKIIVATMKEYSRQLKCYSITEEKLLWEIEDLDDIEPVSFSEDDKEVIAVGNDAVYRIDSKNGTLIKEIYDIRDTYPQHSHISTWSFLSKSGQYLVIWQVQPAWSLIDIFRRSVNKKVSVWDIKNEKIIASFKLPEGGLRSAVFSHDEKSVFLGGEKVIFQWDLEKNIIINTDFHYDLETLKILQSRSNFEF